MTTKREMSPAYKMFLEAGKKKLLAYMAQEEASIKKEGIPRNPLEVLEREFVFMTTQFTLLKIDAELTGRQFSNLEEAAFELVTKMGDRLYWYKGQIGAAFLVNSETGETTELNVN